MVSGKKKAILRIMKRRIRDAETGGFNFRKEKKRGGSIITSNRFKRGGSFKKGEGSGPIRGNPKKGADGQNGHTTSTKNSNQKEITVQLRGGTRWFANK